MLSYELMVNWYQLCASFTKGTLRIAIIDPSKRMPLLCFYLEPCKLKVACH